MFATTPIRIFIVCALLTLLGFAFAAWTAGAVLPVLVGVAGVFAAGLAVIVEVENDDQNPPRNPWEVAR